MADKSQKKKPDQQPQRPKVNSNNNVLKKPKGISKVGFREIAKWMADDMKKERNSNR